MGTSWSKARTDRIFSCYCFLQTAHDHCGGGEFICAGAIQSLSSSCSTFISGRRRNDLKNFGYAMLGIIRTSKNANLDALHRRGRSARLPTLQPPAGPARNRIPRASTAAPSLRCSAGRNAQRTTRATCATRPPTRSVFISKSNTRARLQSSSIARRLLSRLQ